MSRGITSEAAPACHINTFQIKYQLSAPIDPLSDPDYEPPPPPISNGFFAWFSPVIHMKEEQMIANIGRSHLEMLPNLSPAICLTMTPFRSRCNHLPPLPPTAPAYLLRHLPVRRRATRRQYRLQSQVRGQQQEECFEPFDDRRCARELDVACSWSQLSYQ